MKKFLSLVLALVMTMSLVTVGAGAKFTDDSSITYKEAVDVVNALGIVDGRANGDFAPTDTLSRQAAAKIICNLLLGPTVAGALKADAAPYKDVPASNQFAGYIAYCQKAGIISGYADGNFRPTANLTGYAFLKMLLGALGYDANTEGFVGANWSVNVAKLALGIGLDKGLETDLNGTAPATREQAALYAFNTLKSTMVKYNNTVIVGTNGVVSTDKGSAVALTTTAATKDVVENIKRDEKVQFAEIYFTKLTKNTEDDAFNRPATTWFYKGEKVGTYAKTPDKTYVGDVKINAIYADLGMNTKDTTADFSVDGNTEFNITVQKSDDTKLSKLAAVNAGKVGTGTLVEVFRDDDDNHVDIIAMSVYGGKVSDVKEATSKKDAYVVVTGSSVAPTGFGTGTTDEYETTSFEEDDIVAYTFSDKTHEIKSMYKMDSVEGSLTLRTVGKSLKLGDTTYKYAAQYGFDGITENSLTNKSDYVVYTDANGYALYIEEAKFATDAYAVVLKITSENPATFDENKAQLLMADGTKKTVLLKKDYQDVAIAGIAAKDLVRFKEEANGEFVLNKIDAVTATTAFEIANKKVEGLDDTTCDSKTIFVVENNSYDGYNVYTGVKNAPNVEAGQTGGGKAIAIAYTKDGVAKVVFVLHYQTSTSSKDVTFVAGKSVSKRVTSNDMKDYYQYNAVVKGEITTINVSAESGIAWSGAKVNSIVNNTTLDSDNIITAANFTAGPVSTGMKHGVKKVSTEEVKLDGATFAVSSNVSVFIIDVDGNIEASDMSGVKTVSTNDAYYTMEDGEITNLFIVETV